VPRLPLLAIPIAVLAIAGCGSSSSSNTTSNSAATTPTTTAPGPTSGVLVASKSNSLGTILAAGPTKRTVYLFEKDRTPASTCTGECASDWPPVTTTGAPTTSDAAVVAKLGTITRADGTKQITYAGHPLYFFEADTDAADAKGQGSHAFGAGWYVMTPSGAKIDNDDGDDSGGDDDS
jgi:predicted lipoprotein with Yx(FWY)xxD motif